MATFFQMPPSHSALFVNIFDKNPDPLYIWKRYPGGIVRLEAFNKAAEIQTENKIAGYIGIEADKLYASCDNGILADLISVFENKNSLHKEFEYQYQTTGRTVWLTVDYIFVCDDFVMVSTKNIDRTVNLAKLAEDSTEMLRAMFAISEDAHVIADAKGKVLLANEGAVRMFGFDSMEDFKKTSTADLYCDENVRVAFLNSVNKNKINNFQVRAKRKNNSEFCGLLSGAKITLNKNDYYYGHLKDVSELSKMEKELCETRNIFENIMQSVKEGIIVLNSNFDCLRINPAACQILGISSEEIKGKSFQAFALKENPPEMICRVYSYLTLFESGEWELTVKSEQQIQFFSLSILHSHELILINLKNITDQVKRDEDIQRAQRMETIGRVAGQISHDFNNLLSPLIVIPEVLKKQLDGNSKAVKLINLIQRAGEEMSEINGQLKSLASCGNYKFSPVDVNKIFNDLLSLISIPDQLEVIRDVQPDIMMVSGDESQLMRVFMNLLRNAQDAITGPGTITFKSEHLNIDVPLCECPNLLPGSYVKLTLSDTGCGISEDCAKHIFDPFFTTKKLGQRKGLGLGLSIVSEIIADHNGAISFTSKPGSGTSFFVYLPVSHDKIVPDDRDCSAFQGSESILIVDDNQFHIESLHQMLKDLGYKITLTSSPREALYLIRNRYFDLIILDFKMPEMNGLELYREIIRFKPSQKTLMVTGYAESDQLQEALDLGVCGFMTKPVKYRELAVTIRKILATKPIPN